MVSKDIQEIVLKHAPVVEDRLYFLGDATKSMVIEINMNVSSYGSEVSFLLGNDNFRQSTEDRLDYSCLIGEDEIVDLIRFIVDDMDNISGFSIDNQNLKLRFVINWCDKTIKGMSCSKILLNIKCGTIRDKAYGHNLLKKIIVAFKEHLSRCMEFQRFINGHVESNKNDYFGSMNREEMFKALSVMSDEDIRRLLSGMDNELYKRYFLGMNLTMKVPTLEERNGS